MSDAADILLFELHGDCVVVLRLNRPDKHNALATDLLGRIADALDQLAADPQVRAVVITGSAKVFAAGADIRELAERETAGAMGDLRPAIWARIRGFAKPLIAAVEGWSLGAGNELVMCCDLAVSGERGKFGQPETNLGIIPGAGGTVTLPRLVGRSRAMEMVLLGQPLTAAEALAAGLICKVVPDGEALGAAIDLAQRIAARAPLAMQQGKALVRAAFDTGQSAHLAMERQAFAALFGTADKREGISAFLEKREPNWTGN